MTNQPETLLALERYMPYRLSIVSNKVSSIVAQIYKDKFALSITEWRIMAVLGEYPGVSADEISVKTQIEKSLISRAISNLLKRKLVQRSIARDDKRRSEITLSETGYEVYAEIAPLSLQYEKALLDCLSEQEQTQLSEMIDRLYLHAQTIKADT
ncbi:MarR family transcriptional regulator [Glaciecola sp. XM2]|jgi:DNA-binding MarR family transcriptional regulator|uniref:MarR family winged helix-turn-helix transcriptional regulator n=1 Tax=Glaciecola sp. XM2 TaxID=1914931 RepID=UPI001BDE01B0|nr:MarR family transcriptional regulator [Glaciecola sp. XM2]MBT1451256.1 MarR family transcriptional regulator [Glaciecola sp. XM2]